MTENLWLALITGLVGSLHCAGMCGPIAFSLPFDNSKGTANFLNGRVIYNLGRIITYGLLGALVGSFGSALRMAGLQQYLSMIAGGILIIAVLFGYVNKRRQIGILTKASNAVRNGFSRYYSKSTWGAMGIIGLINGLLPCGLVITALAIALAAGTATNGFFVMLVFGLGTFPMMFVLSISRKFISALMWKKFTRWSPIFALIIGVIFVLRGANLGIPYLSPHIDHTANHAECCRPD